MLDTVQRISMRNGKRNDETYNPASNGPAIVARPTSSPPRTSISVTNHSHPRSTHPPLLISSNNPLAASIPRSSGEGGDQFGVLAEVESEEVGKEGGGQEVVSEEWCTADVEVARSVRAYPGDLIFIHQSLFEGCRMRRRTFHCLLLGRHRCKCIRRGYID